MNYLVGRNKILVQPFRNWLMFAGFGELWDFREILKAIAEACQDSRSYFADDTLRTVQLLQRSGGGK